MSDDGKIHFLPRGDGGFLCGVREGSYVSIVVSCPECLAEMYRRACEREPITPCLCVFAMPGATLEGMVASGPQHDPRCRKYAASAPAPVESAPGAYCTRCHMTEALHHQPNIYTGKKDGRGNPYPQPCDAFTPPAEPGTCRECRRTGVALTPDGYCKTCFVAGCGTGRRDTPPLPAEPGTCPVHKEHKAQQVDRPCRKCGTGPVFFHDGMGSTTTDEHWWCLKCGAEGYVDGIDS